VSTEPIDDSYEPFSREPEYVEANRGFIESLKWDADSRVLDLACGTGTLADVLLQLRPKVRLEGVDISHESLLLAEEHFARQRAEGARIAFVEGSAERLPFRDGVFDAVMMGNAIHLLPDTAGLLREIARMLRCGGLFAFNTAFYAGTFVAGTEPFYHQWMREAVAYIQRTRQAAGEVAGRRRRGTVSRAFSNRWRRPDEWVEELKQHGFDVEQVYERTVIMTQRSFEKVGAYAGLARVLLSGYPVALACEALQASVGPALVAVESREIPRQWLEVAAIRR
jgi:ubiquinone/menaquinone biosynthesis C-methylase UbiE